MYRVQEIALLPANFPVFAAEAAGEIAGIYGAEAGTNYRQGAASSIQASLDSGAVRALSATDDVDAADLLLFSESQGIGSMTFLHVLAPHAGRRVEELLLRECVRMLRENGVESIVSECVPLCRMDLEAAYASLEFECIPRALMECPLDAPALISSQPASTPIARNQYGEAASVIVDAYQDSPTRKLHAEVRSVEAAHAFIERAANGESGPVVPGCLRAMYGDGKMTGVIIGCQTAPHHGFVLQAGVRRPCQRRGIGKALIADISGAFREEGMTHLALGATLSIPAYGLYRSLGFQVLRTVCTYVWQRR